jgi:hypothetical protein
MVAAAGRVPRWKCVMAESVRAYRCGEVRVGDLLPRERGLRVGATMGDAITQWTNRDGVEYGTSWPLRVFEGSVASGDVLSIEEHAMRV